MPAPCYSRASAASATQLLSVRHSQLSATIVSSSQPALCAVPQLRVLALRGGLAPPFEFAENSHIVLPRICMKYQNIFCRLRIRNNVCIFPIPRRSAAGSLSILLRCGRGALSLSAPRAYFCLWRTPRPRDAGNVQPGCLTRCPTSAHPGAVGSRCVFSVPKRRRKPLRMQLMNPWPTHA